MAEGEEGTLKEFVKALRVEKMERRFTKIEGEISEIKTAIAEIRAKVS